MSLSRTVYWSLFGVKTEYSKNYNRFDLLVKIHAPAQDNITINRFLLRLQCLNVHCNTCKQIKLTTRILSLTT